ncbi:MAG TPA: Ig-like domain-containing protein, partial [Gemmatimonadales bacterium]|nr:Ig-like domain-containing protein [Gemmatimonadales bacterium]
QPPPGGPPDSAPPVLVSVTPDSGAVVPEWRDPVTFRFDEVIDERSGGGLDRLVLVSPLPERVNLDWRRQGIAIRPDGGWRPQTTYHVTLLPGVTDLRGNRLGDGKVLVFSTGGPVPSATISGTVVDWEAGRATPRALVRATLLPDSLVYLAAADSAGDFRLGALPAGRYHVAALADANNNRRQDGREPFDSATIDLDSLTERVFWTFRQDTLGPSLTRVTAADSQAVRLEFGQALALSEPRDGAVQVLILPDSQPVGIRALWSQTQFDSLRGTRPAGRGPGGVAPDSTQPDTAQVAAPAVTPTDAPTPAAPSGLPGPTPGTPGAGPRPAATAPDTGRVARLLAQRPRPATSFVVELEAPLVPGGRYVIVAEVANLVGAPQRSRMLLVAPEARPGR